MRQIFLGKLIVARRHGNDAMLALIQKQRLVSQIWYDHLIKDFPETSQQDPDDFFVISYRIYRDRATLHWLDYLERQIQQGVDPLA
jgi:hypothetical protein